MKKFILFFTLIFTICSCSNSYKISSNESFDQDQIIPDKYFDSQIACFSYWQKLTDEWKFNGGGLKSSIAETRYQIAGDKKSKLAKLIRETWLNQKQPESTFGYWPYSPDSAQYIYYIFMKQNESDGDVPKECTSGVELESALWEELIKNSAIGESVELPSKNRILKFKEVPNTILWESPYASKWTMHWLLKRFDENIKP